MKYRQIIYVDKWFSVRELKPVVIYRANYLQRESSLAWIYLSEIIKSFLVKGIQFASARTAQQFIHSLEKIMMPLVRAVWAQECIKNILVLRDLLDILQTCEVYSNFSYVHFDIDANSNSLSSGKVKHLLVLVTHLKIFCETVPKFNIARTIVTLFYYNSIWGRRTLKLFVLTLLGFVRHYKLPGAN